MLTFKLERVTNTTSILSLDIGVTRIITGCFFDEDSLCRDFAKKAKAFDEMEVDSTDVSTVSLTSQRAENHCDMDDERIESLLYSADIIVVCNFQEILALPFLLKKFGLQDKIRVICTTPIIQIAKHYLKEFYSGFNKLVLDRDKLGINCITCVNDSDIDLFTDKIVKMNFNEKFNADSHVKIILSSSGYELGSSNLIVEYFNKRISVMSKWSNYKYRYPKEFDYSSLLNADVLIALPGNINYSTGYENALAALNSEIYKIVSKEDTNYDHYPSIFIPSNWSFLLDFVDLMRFKFPKEIKSFYISPSIKAVCEYANISHSFINQFIHNKIYEFKLPFSFDELKKNEQLFCFRSFDDFLKNYVKIKSNEMLNSPVIYMVNKFSFVFSEAQNVFESFVNNSNKNDALIYLSDSVNNVHKHFEFLKDKLNKENKFKVLNFNLDTRGTFEQFRQLIECIKPDMFYYFEKESSNLDFIKYVSNKSELQSNPYYNNKAESITFDTEVIRYENVYYLGKDKNELDDLIQKAESNPQMTFNMRADKENDNFYLTLQPSLNLFESNKSPTESFEEDLNLMLKANDMIINEFLCRENCIKISIIRKAEKEGENSDIFSEVTIDTLLGEAESSIHIECEDHDDSEFLNKLFRLVFAS